MTASVSSRAWRGLIGLCLVLAVVLFAAAGTVRYWQAWVYLAIFTGLSGVLTFDLIRRDPALLERRLKGGPQAEQRPLQRLVMLVISLGFLGLIVVPAVAQRFQWLPVPVAGIVVGDVLFVAGFLLIGRVYRENSYASATVGIAEDQCVISTGPYAIVRHPMYACAMLYLLGTPLALGSYAGLLPFVVMLPCFVWRLIDEERMLVGELPGYEQYRHVVRWRLLPHIW